MMQIGVIRKKGSKNEGVARGLFGDSFMKT